MTINALPLPVSRAFAAVAQPRVLRQLSQVRQQPRNAIHNTGIASVREQRSARRGDSASVSNGRA